MKKYAPPAQRYYRTKGLRHYEITNHLGNVMATISDRKLGQSPDGDTIINYYHADLLSAQDYYPGGMLMPGRSYSSDNYRFGFNGKENDNEVKGTGNSLDFGARIYDTRTLRWASLDPKSKAYISPYQYGSCNPIIFVDPDGNTEFYFNGKWIGTDGVNNGLIGLVKDRHLKREIKSATRHGKTFTIEGVENGFNKDGLFVIHHDILAKAYGTLGNALTKGKNKEFWATMKKEGNGYSTTSEGAGKEGSGQSDGFPTDLVTDVSIHSHPTGFKLKDSPLGKTVESYPADEPSPGDVGGSGIFKNFLMNIIVGKNGTAGYEQLPNGNVQVNDQRGEDGGINIWLNGNESKQPDKSISGDEAGKVLSGDRGRLGRKYDKAKTK